MNDSSSVKFISLYMLKLVLVLTQLYGAMPTVLVSHLNTMNPDHGQFLCYLFCEYMQQQYAPYNIGPNNRANTFISKFVSQGFHYNVNTSDIRQPPSIMFDLLETIHMSQKEQS